MLLIPFLFQHEYTFLLYLNPNWTADMYGETIFLDQIQDMKYDKKGQVIQEKAYETIGEYLNLAFLASFLPMFLIRLRFLFAVV